MNKRNNSNYYCEKKFQEPEAYWQDKYMYHIQKLKYEIKKLKELVINVDIDSLCAEFKEI